MISTVPTPSTVASTIRARQTCFCRLLRSSTIDRSRLRSVGSDGRQRQYASRRLARRRAGRNPNRDSFVPINPIGRSRQQSRQAKAPRGHPQPSEHAEAHPGVVPKHDFEKPGNGNSRSGFMTFSRIHHFVVCGPALTRLQRARGGIEASDWTSDSVTSSFRSGEIVTGPFQRRVRKISMVVPSAIRYQAKGAKPLRETKATSFRTTNKLARNAAMNPIAITKVPLPSRLPRFL